MHVNVQDAFTFCKIINIFLFWSCCRWCLTHNLIRNGQRPDVTIMILLFVFQELSKTAVMQEREANEKHLQKVLEEEREKFTTFVTQQVNVLFFAILKWRIVLQIVFILIHLFDIISGIFTNRF